MKTNHEIQQALGNDSPCREFGPVAYYDKHMDCIRIEVRDCSITEERIDERLTLLMDNHPSHGQSEWAGLMIKGVRHLFTQWNIPLSGVMLVTELLDHVIKDLPEAAENIRPVKELANTIELTVNFDRPDDFDLAA